MFMVSHVRRSRYVETSVADIIFTTDLQIPEISRNEEGVDGVEIMEGTVEVFLFHRIRTTIYMCP